jgi:hypothetical protein
MDLFSFLATIILITSVVTLVVALAAYIAYKIREVRKPQKKKREVRNVLDEPIFLKPVTGAMLHELKQSLERERSVQHQAWNTPVEQMRPQRQGRYSSVSHNKRS